MKFLDFKFHFFIVLGNIYISFDPNSYLVVCTPYVSSNLINSTSSSANPTNGNNGRGRYLQREIPQREESGNMSTYRPQNTTYGNSGLKKGDYIKLANNFKKIVERVFVGFAPFIVPIIGAFYNVSNVTKIFFLFIFILRVLAYLFDGLIPLCSYILPIFSTFSFIDFIMRTLPYAVKVTISFINYLLLREYSIHDLVSYAFFQAVLTLLSLFFFYLTCYFLKGSIYFKKYKSHGLLLFIVSYIYIKFESFDNLSETKIDSFLVFCYGQLRNLSAMIGIKLHFELLFTFFFWILASMVYSYLIKIANKSIGSQYIQQFLPI